MGFCRSVSSRKMRIEGKACSILVGKHSHDGRMTISKDYLCEDMRNMSLSVTLLDVFPRRMAIASVCKGWSNVEVGSWDSRSQSEKQVSCVPFIDESHSKKNCQDITLCRV